MRDPKRIPPMMKEMGELWKRAYPDWRFGQLMMNFIYWLNGRDIFFYEDDKFLELFRQYCSGDSYTVDEETK